MRSSRSHMANQANTLHIQVREFESDWKKLFKTNFADVLWNELLMWIPKWDIKCPIIRRFGGFADSCSSFEQFCLIKNQKEKRQFWCAMGLCVSYLPLKTVIWKISLRVMDLIQNSRLYLISKDHVVVYQQRWSRQWFFNNKL